VAVSQTTPTVRRAPDLRILALRRVYAESTGVTLLKAASLLLLTVVLNGLASFVAIRTTLALV